MKKQIILYAASFLITFLTIYIKNLSGAYYPVTSTFGIEGNKVSYRLDKIHYGNSPINIFLITDLNGIEGNIFCKNEITVTSMIYNDKILSADIPSSEPMTKIEYRIVLNYNNKEYKIPRDGSFHSVEVFGLIPKVVVWLHYILLFAGLFISIRIGLDYFDNNNKSKKLSVIVLSVFTLFSLMINPLKNSFRLGVINESIPELTSLFDLQAILFVFTWLSAVPLIFNKRTTSAVAVSASIITIIIFVSFAFVV